MQLIDPDKTRQRAFVLSQRRTKGIADWHTHQRAQLLYVSEGIVKVCCGQDWWLCPPERAVWVLPGVLHTVISSHPYHLCTLYTDPELVALPSRCAVVAVRPLLRQLLLEAAQFGAEYKPKTAAARLIHVLLDRVPTMTVSALYLKKRAADKLGPVLHLPEPTDERLNKITNALQRNPADREPLSKLAKEAGISPRNAERLFHRETGMTFGRWRRELRLAKALEFLAKGECVTQVAFAVGYEDVSSFIGIFKRSLGETPGELRALIRSSCSN